MVRKGDAIVFIDGNNFYHNLKASFIDPGKVHFGKLSELVCNRFDYNHKKSIGLWLPSILLPMTKYGFRQVTFLYTTYNMEKFINLSVFEALGVGR